jgi:putative inorganic carbon (HCO3(-)) transporter
MQSLTNKSGSDKGGTAVSILGILVLLAFSVGIAVFLNKVPDGGLETLCLLLGLLPALILGFTSSVYQVPYILSVWAIEPELRRLIDWSYGQYHSITVMTLLPILATMTLLLPIVRRRRSINKGLRPGIYLYCAALAYGLMIGWIHNGFAAAYEFVTYVVPLLLVFYMYQRPFTDAQRSMIFRSFSGIAILIAIYGWIQYLTAPAWDTFWMLNCGMGSIGSPHPLQIRVFSTLNSPGPAAAWLGLSLCMSLAERRWRPFLGWPGVAIVASGLALTLVRGVWIGSMITMMVYIALSPGAKRVNRLIVLAFILAALVIIVPRLPGGDQVSTRIVSLGSLQHDDSFNKRAAILIDVIHEVASDPVGRGLGATGTATKTNDSSGRSAAFDNGFGAIFVTFGWVCGVAFFVGIFLMMRYLLSTAGLSPAQRSRCLFCIAYVVAILYGLAVANSIPGIGGIMLWLVYSAGVGYKPQTTAVVPAIELPPGRLSASHG